MQGVTEGVHRVVRGVDQRVDGIEANGLEALLDGLGRGLASDHASDFKGAVLWAGGGIFDLEQRSSARCAAEVHGGRLCPHYVLAVAQQ